ncbi:hypothetical protein HII17_12295 [Thalassotalea sp. M1531]|uniref:Uncharacterized protein n=1 Tax=Thalassotalea algicola TaxID=2716224 RepID=A0A7Y0Q7F1_9GAMM|nr:hypothetical protein [Thalassotalea algicola]NMP32343.1 hypothetical protein [Thalassotalea algicola]
MKTNTELCLDFSIIPGFQVASGKAENSPYPKGTIALQAPYFKDQGINLDGFYKGTINAEFNCDVITIDKYDYKVDQLTWCQGVAPETFIFISCKVQFKEKHYPAFIYHPIGETKIGHLQPQNCLEIVAPFINGLEYGSQAKLVISNNYLTLKQNG